MGGCSLFAVVVRRDSQDENNMSQIWPLSSREETDDTDNTVDTDDTDDSDDTNNTDDTDDTDDTFGIILG